MKKEKNTFSGINRRLIAAVVYTVLLFSGYVLYASRVGAHLLRVGIGFGVGYIVGIAVIMLVGRSNYQNGEIKQDRLTMSRVLYDGITNLSAPALMCYSDGKVFWTNGSLEALLAENGVNRPVGKNISELLGTTLENIVSADIHDGYAIDLFPGRLFLALSGNVKFSGGASFIILSESMELKTSRDMLELAHQQIEESEPVVAHIMIDNLSEMVQYDSESYRRASAKVDELLREWAVGISGIIREYDRDRYLLVTERRALHEVCEKKFDILDKIREVRVGPAQLPVTLSMGVASSFGSFSEKEKTARAALELALGRGGDQVVIKDNEDITYYGGKTKILRSRNSVRSRVVGGELIGRMSEASGVIIMGHRYGDCDSIASSVGLARIAMFCGVDVRVVVNKNDENVMRCIETIADLPEYKNVFVSSDDAMDMMKSDTLLVITDVNNKKILEDVELADAAKQYIVIDHHRKHKEFEREPLIEYIEPTASSASELVTELCEVLLPAEYMISVKEATVLLAGIMLDTQLFTRNTGTRTYSAALYLHNLGATPGAAHELLKADIVEYRRETEFRAETVVYRNDFAITFSEGSGNIAADKITAAKTAESLVTVRGIKAAFAIVTLNDSMHISARSSGGNINVQLILEKLGGGGHYDNAAAQISSLNAEETIGKLKLAIDEYIKENKINMN